MEKSKHTAVGIHVFAGGFTLGVQKVMDVKCQLESHGLGKESVEVNCGIPFRCMPVEEWPDIPASFAYGNPRCTGFSTITSGYDESAHGAWSKPTQDIHDLCNYAVGRYDAIIWESVQQAYTVGRPLLDYLRDTIFVPAGYRIAHVFLNAASFGNSQQRKRYFFIAYRSGRNFNIIPPNIDHWYGTMYDAIWNLRHRETNEMEGAGSTDYNFDTYYKMTDDENKVIRKLPNGWSLNMLGKYKFNDLTPKYQTTYKYRTSDMPFSMHCVYRTNWMRPSPTLHSSCVRFIHPDLNRPLTIGEISTIMGWENCIPHGKQPAAQIAKGICPSAGTWLAQQVELYLNDEWGDEDWESSYNDKNCMWEGKSAVGQIEKTFNLTRYYGRGFDIDRFDSTIGQKHICNIDLQTGKLKRGWNDAK